MVEVTKKVGDTEVLVVKADEIPFSTNGVTDVGSLFVDAIRGASVAEGVARINLIEYKMSAKNEIQAKHALTLVMPATQIRAWAAYLAKIADENGL